MSDLKVIYGRVIDNLKNQIEENEEKHKATLKKERETTSHAYEFRSLKLTPDRPDPVKRILFHFLFFLPHLFTSVERDKDLTFPFISP